MWRNRASRLISKYGWLWALLTLVLGVSAQLFLDEKHYVAGGVLFALVALFSTCLLTSGSVSPAVKNRDHSLPRVSDMYWVGLALLLGTVALFLFEGNRFALASGGLWLLGCACLLVPVVSGLRGVFGDISLSGMWPWFLAVMAITAIGAFFRLYKLDVLPAEMGCDVPHVYHNVAQILSGEFPVFFPSHPGREGLFFYLIAPIAALAGQSFLAIKLTSALLGTLTIPLVYEVGKLLWNRRAGLAAALFLSVNHWHILMSRSGLRAITLPVVLLLLIGSLVRAWRSGSTAWYILAGFCLGMGFYTYNAFMAVPLIVLAWLMIELLSGNTAQLRQQSLAMLFCAIAACVVLVPLVSYVTEDPTRYFYRAATRVSSVERALPGNLMAVFARNVLDALLMFNVRGDAVHVANLPYLRQLGSVSGALLVIGATGACRRWRVSQNAWVLIAGLGMLGPSMLALAFPNEVPNAIRAIGACPIAILLVGYGANLLMGTRKSGESLFPGGHQLLLSGALLAALFGYEMGTAWKTCFVQYPAALPYRNYSISLDMATTIAENDGQGTVVIWPHWYDGNAVACQLDSMGYDSFCEVSELGTVNWLKPDSLFLLHPQDVVSIERLTFNDDAQIVNHIDYEGNIAFVAVYGDS